MPIASRRALPKIVAYSSPSITTGFPSKCCGAPVLLLGSNGARRNSQRMEWGRCQKCTAEGWVGDEGYVPHPSLACWRPWEEGCPVLLVHEGHSYRLRLEGLSLPRAVLEEDGQLVGSGSWLASGAVEGWNMAVGYSGPLSSLQVQTAVVATLSADMRRRDLERA